MRLRLLAIFFGMILLSGAAFVQAQDDEGTGCYPGGRDGYPESGYVTIPPAPTC